MTNATTISGNAAELVRQIQEHAPDSEVRIFRGLQIGHAIHQGDVYMHRVPNDWPRGKKLGTRQVAVGSTIGSRHIMLGDGVEVFEGKRLPPSLTVPEGFTEAAFLGPVVTMPDDTDLTHPEHSHHKNGMDECVTLQVTYQGDYSTRRRVED